MLRLLLDAHCDPHIGDALGRLEPACFVVALRDWQDGRYLRSDDAAILQAALRHGLTLVTRDVHSIPKLLEGLYEQRKSHAGVIFISEWSFPLSNIGMIARALQQEWADFGHEDWRNRAVFLRPVR